ncbi:MAG: AMP-binding protein [Clostridiales Family XIII bacterium]|jgi:acyl-coenzyme A synthetase/AMP-(fatty) acid ligase|nr:AMP-binding protein [Clostridiales Family XIII bacterium]
MIFQLDEKDRSAPAAVSESGSALTYGALLDAAGEVSDAVKSRSLVFILAKNTIASLCCYIGCITKGAVPLLLDAGIDGKLLENLIAAYHPSYLFSPEGRLSETGLAPFALHEDLGLLLTTSGSTGSPKLIRQTVSNMEANAKSIAGYLGLTKDERPITTLPMNYTYGLSILHSHLLVGAAILLTEKSILQKEFWQFFREGEATSFGGVPYTYEMLKKLRFFRMELPSLRTMTQAGGKLPSELHREFAEYAARTGRNFVVMYGQTEATARMSYLPPKRALEKTGSMGIAIPGGKLSLIDAGGREIADADTVGELVYEGPNVTMGYAESGADLAKDDEWQGRLETGDMAKKDQDGYYYIVGRKKRFLKIYGNRVNLDEVEQIIKNNFGLECACAGVDDHMNIFITDETFADSVRKSVSETTGIYFRAFEVRVIREIPKNEAGKTLYKELEESGE